MCEHNVHNIRQCSIYVCLKQLKLDEHKVEDVRKEVANLGQLHEQRNNERATQITELHDRVDDLATKVEQALEKQNQVMATSMTEFRNSLNDFKKAMKGLDKKLEKRVVQERNRAKQAEAQLKEDFEGKQAAFTKKLDADTQALKTYLEKDVKTSIDSVANALKGCLLYTSPSPRDS